MYRGNRIKTIIHKLIEKREQNHIILQNSYENDTAILIIY